MIGTSLSHYDITAELGRGGMGIVYKARDTKLDRDVAIKILPSAALASTDDRERFYREAKSAAQLHHPNIASVFEIDEAVPEGSDSAEPRPFIAMEYIEGVTLQDRIKEAPLKLSDAVKVASQVAEALKAAHAKDIVHRDIKSANVMITEEGIAKVLDFGLAKTNQSTMLTRMGSTLGTVAYMSPEQARGQQVDGRTDLYSLGTMLYEMVAGKLPFAGEYEQAVVYGILNEPPEPLTSLRTGVPMELERIVNKLLAKDAEYRYQSAAGLLADLKSLDLSGSAHSRRSVIAMPESAVIESVQERRIPNWVWVALPAAVLLGASAAWTLRPDSGLTADRLPTVRSEIVLNDDRASQAVAVSPDGGTLAYSDAENGSVYVRDLETGEERQIPNTSGIIELDFSPDGQWLLLDEQQAVLRAPVTGGSPVRLTTMASNAPHSSWVDNDRILFDDRNSIYMMSLSSGEIEPVVTADSATGEIRLLWGRVSPDLRYMFARIIRDPDTPRFGVYTFPDGEVVMKEDWDAVSPRYLAPGHLLVLEDSDLMARPFDLENASFRGAPVRIAEGISETNWDLSPVGQLVLGPITSFQFSSSSAVVPTAELGRGAAGEESTRLPLPPARYADMRVSPDGNRLALEIYDPGVSFGDTWVIDFSSGIREQLTFQNTGDEPVWSPDGDSLAVITRDEFGSTLSVMAADGSGTRRMVWQDSSRAESPDWSGEANLIVLVLVADDGTRDLWFVDPVTGESRPAVESVSQLSLPVFSPNGRYFAFEQDQRIIVRTTSLDGGVWDLSQGVAESPRWAPDGTGLYYTSGGAIYRVPVQTDGTFRRLGGPEKVVDTGSTALFYAPIPGSDELIYVMPLIDDELRSQIPLQLISNAPAMIRRKAPPLR